MDGRLTQNAFTLEDVNAVPIITRTSSLSERPNGFSKDTNFAIVVFVPMNVQNMLPNPYLDVLTNLQRLFNSIHVFRIICLRYALKSTWYWHSESLALLGGLAQWRKRSKTVSCFSAVYHRLQADWVIAALNTTVNVCESLMPKSWFNCKNVKFWRLLLLLSTDCYHSVSVAGKVRDIRWRLVYFIFSFRKVQQTSNQLSGCPAHTDKHR